MAQTIEQLKQLVVATTDEQIAGMTPDDRKAFFAAGATNMTVIQEDDGEE